MMMTYTEPPCIFLTCVPVCTNTPPPLPPRLPPLHFLLFLVRYPPSPSSSVGSSIERASACVRWRAHTRRGCSCNASCNGAALRRWPTTSGRAGEEGKPRKGRATSPLPPLGRAHTFASQRGHPPRVPSARAPSMMGSLPCRRRRSCFSQWRKASERPSLAILRSYRLSSERARGVF